MRMYDLIMKKKHGEVLTEQEIQFMIDGYVKGEIPDYQMSAMLMAIWFKGMNDLEITELTKTMAKSGDMIDLSAISGKKVDKHSTGRRWRQDNSHCGANRCGLRRQGGQDVWPRSRTYGGHG